MLELDKLEMRRISARYIIKFEPWNYLSIVCFKRGRSNSGVESVQGFTIQYPEPEFCGAPELCGALWGLTNEEADYLPWNLRSFIQTR